VIDLDAIQNEADDKPFEFTFGGEQYELPPRMDMRVVAVLTKGQVGEALEMLLGPEQWQRMLHADAVLDERRLSALLAAYTEHTGMSVGESSASANSSKGTRTPSKRTSNGTTTYR
jgi:hypothetical protein